MSGWENIIGKGCQIVGAAVGSYFCPGVGTAIGSAAGKAVGDAITGNNDSKQTAKNEDLGLANMIAGNAGSAVGIDPTKMVSIFGV